MSFGAPKTTQTSMGELFPDHPKSGFYFSAKGQTLSPYELDTLESSAMGDSRHQAPTTSPSWDSTTVVHTGLTAAEGSYHSDLPNH
jgi:hypothetical protein